MKKILMIFLMLTLIIGTVVTSSTKVSAAKDDASMYVDLKGDWNFKLYRTYNRMFQNFLNDTVKVTWEDNELAKQPSSTTWHSWEKVALPADDITTGGLLPLKRTDGSNFFPSWSEAWMVRNFDLPNDFTVNDNVTLLLGIIDDLDVVYINGQLVESSGFIDGNGKKTNPSAVGGFDYKNADLTNQVKFEKSYWEVQREYTIPASLLKQGQTNEIAIRVYNNNSYGGFYSGKPMVICGNDLAVRSVKGLPATKVNSPEMDATVEKQIQSLQTNDINLYAETIADNYLNNGDNKQARLVEIQSYFDKYTNIVVSDANAGYFQDSQKKIWYSAKRTMQGTNKATNKTETILSNAALDVSYSIINDAALEFGNWSRSYSTSYNSKLFSKKLTYSIYLPEGYWQNTDRKYPVVYLLHGINSSSSSFLHVDHIEAFMDKEIASGDITKMIVVMPDSGKNAFYKDTPLNPNSTDTTGPWATQLTDELRNVVEAKYRTINDARFRGITGISMGGYGAMTLGTSHPELYSSVASHMGFLPVEALNSLKTLTTQQLNLYDFYEDSGLQDTMVDYHGTIAIHDYLESMKIKNGFDIRDGGHNSAFYMTGMPDSMKMHSDHFIHNDLYGEEYGKAIFQAAPTGLLSVTEATYHGNDGKITANDGISVTGLVYKLSEDTTYRSVTSFPITGLAPGTYTFKYEAQSGYEESATTSVIVAEYGELLPPSHLTAVDTSLLNTDGKIQGWKDGEDYQAGYIIGYKLKSSRDAYLLLPEVASSIDNLVPGVYSVRYEAHGQLSASQPIEISVKGQQAKPIELTAKAPTSENGSNGTIIGTVEGLEFMKIGDTSYTEATYPTITGLTAGAYQIRYKAKDLFHESDATVVVVPAYVDPSPSSTSKPPIAPVDTGIVKSPVTGNTDKVSVIVPTKTDLITGDTQATIGKDSVTNLVDSAKSSEAEGKSAVVELKVESTEQTKTAQLTIPRSSFNEVATGTKAEVKVDYGNVGTVSFDAKAIDTINSATATGDISIIISKTELTADKKELLGDRPVYDFSVFAGDSKVSSFGGGIVHISLPYVLRAGESPESVIVYYISDQGELLTVRGEFNATTGTVDFTTTHFSEYVIGYNKVSFTDVPDSAWYNKAVSYLAARDITAGTDDTHFSPSQAVTRGQFVVLLLKAYGIDASTSGDTANFSDAGNTYYTGYLAVAKNLGIATGTGDNQFSPDLIITRQDLFTLLYRSLEKLGELPVGKTGGALTDFNDAGKISAYAQTAIRTFVESGIIAGSNNQLDPQGEATRAQVAQVLYNLLSK
jgi:enterochelin esterase-like enzyme